MLLLSFSALHRPILPMDMVDLWQIANAVYDVNQVDPNHLQFSIEFLDNGSLRDYDCTWLLVCCCAMCMPPILAYFASHSALIMSWHTTSLKCVWYLRTKKRLLINRRYAVATKTIAQWVIHGSKGTSISANIGWVAAKQDRALWTLVHPSVWTYNCDRQWLILIVK
jgi:hypothetical protein